MCVGKMESGKEKHLSVKVSFFIKSSSCNHSLNFIPTEILCPDLPNPLGGVVNLTSRTIGSTVTYSCNEGFILNGSAERVCQEDGTWSITPPSCSLVTCPVLPDPEGGVVELQGTSPGDEAVYNCSNSSLDLVGQEIRVCGEDGEWQGEAPICEGWLFLLKV